MRREFQLPECDVDFLNHLGNPWETIIDQKKHKWLIVHNYAIPIGYNHPMATLALRIDAGYPTSQIDMVYFNPALAKVNGGQIKALTNHQIDGTIFQRWSRHRTKQNPWRPEVDDISTHLGLVNYWLEREVGL